jgi:hypothetical protein
MMWPVPGGSCQGKKGPDLKKKFNTFEELGGDKVDFPGVLPECHFQNQGRMQEGGLGLRRKSGVGF